jgi:hypothetical protein
VHGVGDHSESKILSDAAAGFRALAADGGQAKEITLHDFPHPSGESRDQTTLQLEAGGRKHVVIPVIWSDLSLRATHTALLVGIDPMRVLTNATMPLMRLCADAVRCIRFAAGVWWKAAMTLTVTAIFVLLAGLGTAVLYVVSHLPFWIGVAGTANWRWYSPLLLFSSASALTWAVRRFLPLFDFAADVVTYFGRPKRRAEIQNTLAGIIDEAAARAPHARILVVGHSLGSVLVAHAVLEAKEAAGRMIVLTLGSPLRLLSRIFARQIHTPDQLLAAYSETGTVLFWANLWRDRDVIGRELKPAASDRFAETSIGDGVHWDMWHDRRVWKSVDELLSVSPFASLQAAWREREEMLSADEAMEALRRWKTFSFFFWLFPPGFGVTVVLTYRTGFDEKGSMKLPLSVLLPYLALNGLILILLAMVATRALNANQVQGLTRREILGAVRRGTTFCGNCLVGIGLASAGCMFLLSPYI